MIEINKNYNENCLETMKRMEDNFVDLTVTSPPYDNLRTYTGEAEWNFEVFKEIAKELYRVTKFGGVVVWVVGDATIKGSESGTSFKQALYFKEIGFDLHDTMIYQKNNFSNPSKTRYHQIFEYMFIFSKGKPKTFNPICDRKNIYAGESCKGKNRKRIFNGEFDDRPKKNYKEFGMRYNIWKGNTSGQENMCKEIAHPATFPYWLAKDHILSWSNEGDIVYDPFMGSGTTAKMSILNNRNWVGSEISSEYCKIIEERVKKAREEKRKEKDLQAQKLIIVKNVKMIEPTI